MCFVSSEMFDFESGLLLRIALAGGQGTPLHWDSTDFFILYRFFITLKISSRGRGKGLRGEG